MNTVDKGDKMCPNKHCCRDLTNDGASAYSLELPIERQVKKLFPKKNFSSSLKHKWTRNRTRDANIDDIYDGHIYRQLAKCGGPLSATTLTISLSQSTQMVSRFSKAQTVWPVFSDG